MPTYNYRCYECSFEFDRFQKMTDEYLKECPECSGKVQRLVGTGGGLIFKGSGFYQTDYKDAAPKTAPKTDPKTEKSSKADAKPAPCGKTESRSSTEG